MVKRDVELPRDRLEVLVIADDERNVGGELAGPLPQQQVVQTVVVLRDENSGSVAMRAVAQPPFHRKALCHLADSRLEAPPIRVKLRHVELDALKELAGHRVGVLVRIEDVGAVSIQDLRKRGDEASAVGTTDEEGSGILHGYGVAVGEAIGQRRKTQRLSRSIASPKM
jgi:hypothetical protein